MAATVWLRLYSCTGTCSPFIVLVPVVHACLLHVFTRDLVRVPVPGTVHVLFLMHVLVHVQYSNSTGTIRMQYMYETTNGTGGTINST